MVLKVLGACFVVMLAASPVAAQEAAQTKAPSEARVTVAIGNTAAPPDWELSVPVSLTLADGAEVGRLSMRLVYPANALRYVSLKGTETLKKAGFEVTTSARPGKSDEKPSTAGGMSRTPPHAPADRTADKDKKGSDNDKEEPAEMSLEFRPAAGAGGKTLPSGRVAIVAFKVLVDAQTKSWPMTARDVQAWGVGASAAEVTAAAAPAAKFTVSPAGLPIFGCFFYMH